jgi:hypothetical protein
MAPLQTEPNRRLFGAWRRSQSSSAGSGGVSPRCGAPATSSVSKA